MNEHTNSKGWDVDTNKLKGGDVHTNELIQRGDVHTKERNSRQQNVLYGGDGKTDGILSVRKKITYARTH